MTTSAVHPAEDSSRVNKNSKVEQISVFKCVISTQNPRYGLMEGDVSDLAASMANPAIGLIHPIIVALNDDNTFSVITGRRRLEAAKQLGWETIAAIIIDDAKHDLDALATVENLHRRAMTPHEEAIAASASVVELVEKGVDRERAIEQTASLFSRSVTWVRDRLYLQRLSPDLRRLVHSGEIPMDHARRLAQLVDHKAQAKVYEEEFFDYDGKFNLPGLHQIERHIADRVISLAQVPWVLEAQGVAGRQPCNTCPHNTANDVNLFACSESCKLERQVYDSKVGKYVQIKGPFCCDEKCFEAKQRATAKSVEAVANSASAKAQSQLHADPKKASKTEVKQVLSAAKELAESKVPDHIKPAAIEEAIEKKVTETFAAVAPVKTEKTEADREREYKERNKRAEARAKDVRQHDREIAEVIESKPGARLALFVLESHYKARNDLFGSLALHSASKRDKAKVPDKARDFIKDVAAGIVTIDTLEELIADAFTPTHGNSVFRKLRAELGKAGKQFLDETFDPRFKKPEAASETPAKAKKAKSKAKVARSRK